MGNISLFSFDESFRASRYEVRSFQKSVVRALAGAYR